MPLNRTCTHCHMPFVMSDAELAFFERAALQAGTTRISISPPSHCPRCRLQRRMAHRNQIYVSLATVAGYDRPLFSMYFGTPQFPIVSNEDWWDEKGWSPESFGRSFDFGRPFFEQFAELRAAVPRPAINTMLNENSDSCNNTGTLKNCYFVFDANTIEDSLYIENACALRDSIDCSDCFNSELCFDCTGVHRGYNLQSCDHSIDCSDSYYLLNCRSCRNCFGCINLRQAEYCIYNVQYSAEQYHAFLSTQPLASWAGRAAIAKRVEEFFQRYPRPHFYGSRCERVTGNHINSARDVEESFFITEGEKLRYCYSCSQGLHDCQDLTIWGQNAELLYEALICGSNVFHLLFCYNCWNGASELVYCDSCHGSAHLFGCVGMRKRQHCILNRQYSPAEYEALLPKIITHMHSTGEWGEFFPVAISHTPYNFSLAQRHFPLTRAEASQVGYWWLEGQGEGRIPVGAVPSDALPDALPATDTPIVAVSGSGKKAFKITSEEIRRYRRFQVPLPRLAYDERMDLRAARSGSVRLYRRRCAKSGVELITCHPPQAKYPVWQKELLEMEMS